MRVGIISARLGSVDGVSLETDKWTAVLKKMGHKVFFCTGEVSEGYGYSQLTGKHYKELQEATLINDMSFWCKKNRVINKYAFGKNKFDLKEKVEELAEKIKEQLKRWVKNKKIELLIVENASTIPMQIPLGVAIGRLVRGNDIPTILHHHDFYWEREKYLRINGSVVEYLLEYFPFKHKTLKHVVINSIAQKELYVRKKVKAMVIPNVFDYAKFISKEDEYNSDFKEEFGIKKRNIVALAPVRVIPRKDLRTAIRIIARLQPRINRKIVLVVTGYASDVGKPHERNLKLLAEKLNVNVKFIGNRIGARRYIKNREKIYTIWDVYPYCDFVLYPSKVEGWGNALGEALAYKKLIVVRRYPVFRTDIEHLGFEFIAFDKLSNNVINRLYSILNDKKKIGGIVEKNLNIAKKKLSYEVLEEKLEKLIFRLTYLYAPTKKEEEKKKLQMFKLMWHGNLTGLKKLVSKKKNGNGF